MDKPIGGEGTAAARAHSNIALIKYWGKRDAALNIPAVGSISLTLDALSTDTRVTFRADLAEDEFWLGGRREVAPRVSAILDLVRQRAGVAFDLLDHLQQRVHHRLQLGRKAGDGSALPDFGAW